MRSKKAARKADPAPTPYTNAQIAKGDWNPLWDTLREWDSEFIDAYLAFRSVPHRKGPLVPKVKELVLIAINAATTHLYGPGVRRHMRRRVAVRADSPSNAIS